MSASTKDDTIDELAEVRRRRLERHERAPDVPPPPTLQLPDETPEQTAERMEGQRENLRLLRERVDLDYCLRQFFGALAKIGEASCQAPRDGSSFSDRQLEGATRNFFRGVALAGGAALTEATAVPPPAEDSPSKRVRPSLLVELARITQLVSLGQLDEVPAALRALAEKVEERPVGVGS